MHSLAYVVLPQLLLLLFGTLLGIWAILLRRTDLNLESGAQRLGRVGGVAYFLWLVLVTVVQRQVPVLNPGQLAYFLGALIWFGQCYSQRHVNQRLFAVLPLVGVLGLMLFGVIAGLGPGKVTESLLGPTAAVHVTLSLAGVGLLLGCGVYGAGHVILHHQIRTRHFDAWFNRLPSLGDLDRLRRVNLNTGTALVVVSLASAMIWSTHRPAGDPVVVSHLHPMLLLGALLIALVVTDRFRWLSSRNLAVACLVMSVLVLALLTVSVVEIFLGRPA
ncbi:MAG: cytochrome c biogenesis protein CcsA [Candidatus Krumholzibacteriia bacterium]